MDKLFFQELLNRYGKDAIIEGIKPLLTDERKLRIDEILGKRIHGVQLAVEAPYDIHNALAIMRTGEAFGANQLHIIAEEIAKEHGKRIMQGTSRWSHIQRYKSFLDFYKWKDSSNRDFKIAGAVVDGTMSLEEIPLDKPLCLLFGNEHRGLSDVAKESCDYLFTIPMCGMVESLNLSVAASISLYETQKRYREFHDVETDLTNEEISLEKAWYYAGSCRSDHLELIVKSHLEKSL